MRRFYSVFCLSAVALLACACSDDSDNGGKTPPPVVIEKSYKSAIGTYFGTQTDQQASLFQIQLSDQELLETSYPASYLILTLVNDPVSVSELSDLKLDDGLYTVTSDFSTLVPGTIHAGAFEEGGVTGSSMIDVPDEISSRDYTLVSGGTVSISWSSESGYTVSGTLEMKDGSRLELSYSGSIFIDNRSGEGTPADEVEIPDSPLTGDVDVQLLPTEGYCTFYGALFHEYPDCSYVYLMFYTDDTYADCIDLGLLVNNKKYPGNVIPVGKYPIMNRYPSEFATMELSSVAAFTIKTDTNPAINYGCWYTFDYASKAPLVAGEVEVLESDGLNVHIRIRLQDNADTPNTITAEYEGTLMNI